MFEVYHLNVGKSDTALPCTSPSDKFVCSPTEVNKHGNINLDHIPQSLETQQALNKLCEEYKDIFSLDQGDISYTKLLSMATDIGDHTPIAQKPFTVPLKHTELVLEELEVLEKAGIVL